MDSGPREPDVADVALSTSRSRIDIVILTWNDGPLLETAIRSATESSGVDVRVVVVDNGSEPPASCTGEVVSVIRNEVNRGVAVARNQGVISSRAPFVCFLDSDASLHTDCLVRLAEVLATDPSVALAVPVFADQRPEASAGPAPTFARKLARLLNLTSVYRSSGAIEGMRDVDFAIGACQLFRRSAFDEVGGLDESIFYGPEDVDFCLRLRTGGWRVVQVYDAVCDHPPRRRFRGLLTRRGIQHARAMALHLWRHRRFQRTA